MASGTSAFTRNHVRFFALDTNLLDAKQLEWLEQTLSTSTGALEDRVSTIRSTPTGNGMDRTSSCASWLEPLFVRHGVQVAFSGHDHMYERLKPQKGITYFVAGAGGQLREGGVQRSETTATAFDQEQSFLLVDVDEERCGSAPSRATGP